MTMLATVLEVNKSKAFVLDLSTEQEVLVYAENLSRFHPQDVIRIEFDAPMTESVSPHIDATEITLVASCDCEHVHTS